MSPTLTFALKVILIIFIAVFFAFVVPWLLIGAFNVWIGLAFTAFIAYRLIPKVWQAYKEATDSSEPADT